MKKVKSFFSILKEAVVAFLDDRGLKLSASLSYYTVFAIGPLMLIIISLAGIFLGQDAVEGKLYWQLRGLLGNDAAVQIQNIIKNTNQQHNSFAGTIVGVVMLFIGASGVFTEMQDSLNFIWSVKSKPQKGWIKFLMNRLLSFSLVLGLGFILLVSLMVNTLMDILSDRLVALFHNTTTVYFFYALNLLLVFVVISGLFSVIFRVLPDVVIRWKDAAAGAAFTAVFFMLGKFLIGYYIGNSRVGVTYGTAASVIIIFIWVYYSSIILYFGAEFTKIYAIRAGAGIKPSETAVFIVKKEAKEIAESRIS
ncbi:MAG: YihY/virulence factor BrkB family protein [Chitinophagaceae bacterium]